MHANGLGKSCADAVAEIAAIRRDFNLLDETPSILTEWQNLVITHNIIGRNSHDARLVAAMIAHGGTHINDHDFRRFKAITVLTPAAILAGPP